MDARELPTDITELAKVLENVDVLGRVLPDQKKAIVQALHLGDHVVAMTGDGVNDALAIKEADPPPKPSHKWCSSIRNSRICPMWWHVDARSWPTWNAWPACSSSKPYIPR